MQSAYRRRGAHPVTKVDSGFPCPFNPNHSRPHGSLQSPFRIPRRKAAVPASDGTVPLVCQQTGPQRSGEGSGPAWPHRAPACGGAGGGWGEPGGAWGTTRDLLEKFGENSCPVSTNRATQAIYPDPQVTLHFPPSGPVDVCRLAPGARAGYHTNCPPPWRPRSPHRQRTLSGRSG